MSMQEPHIISSPNEMRLNSPPEDGISCMQFSPDPNNQLLAVSSWDTSVRIYDLGNPSTNFQKATYNHAGPVLCCAFVDPSHCASGSLDHTVKYFDLASSQAILMGMHDKPVRCAEWAREVNLLCTGSWDETVKLWDTRSRCVAHTVQQPERVYAMDVANNRLVVGTAGRKVWIWDLRQMSVPEQKRDSSLKYQTRCIRAFPRGDAYVLSSIEGRVAVEYLDQSAEVQKKKYAFKCHRVKENDVEQVYPVNSIAFHPLYNTFATGGSDGLVNLWDPFNKKRLCQFHKLVVHFCGYSTGISSMCFSADGSLLAIASSYQHELPTPPDPIPTDTIMIRKVTDQETRPKNM